MADKDYQPTETGQADAPWLSVARAEMEREVEEVAGSGDNPRILEYFTATSYVAGHDEAPWCSAFVNWCLRQSGFEGTGSAAARSWLAWGRGVDAPMPGCVVVLWRGSPDSSQGHVGFYQGPSSELPAHIDLLGGNQGNRVSIRAYPQERVLAYRMPA